MQDLRDELNDEQYNAVMTLKGALLIIAGAGSGKTRVITFRIANMLNNGIPQNQILALTFTNKAALEMQTRIKELTRRKMQNLTVCTFHAFGVRILRQNASALDYRDNFSIYDETDRISLIKDSAQNIGVTPDVLDLYQTANLISDIKTLRKSLDSQPAMVKRLYQSYQEGLHLYNAVDFDDLIALPIKLFRSNKDILDAYKMRYKYIMVDEFQDTSHLQYELMQLLAKKENEVSNIAVVGDDDQSIYSWRGADYENLLNFEKDFPDCKEIRLEQNYRSTDTILAAANGVISHNTNRKDKALWSKNTNGKPIQVYAATSDNAEADFIAHSIRFQSTEENRLLADFAILVRSNSQLRVLEEALLNMDLPYTVSGGTSFFSKKEIKDIISYLRVITNHDDDVNLLRIINTPRRGVGRATIEKLGQSAKNLECSLWQALEAMFPQMEEGLLDFDYENQEEITTGLKGFHDLIVSQRQKILGSHNFSQKVKEFLDTIGYEKHILQENIKSEKAARYKIMNVNALLKSMQMWEDNPLNASKNLFDYLNRITLITRDDSFSNEDSSKINLMTIHAAKGLEFPVVFIAGVEEGLIPHSRALEDSESNIEEERRLFYVAITRAKERLCLCYSKSRHHLQKAVECVPSQFLQEIPQELIEYCTPNLIESTEKVRNALKSMVKRLSHI